MEFVVSSGGGHTYGTPPRRPYLWYAAVPSMI